jgi:hypothetical protein
MKLAAFAAAAACAMSLISTTANAQTVANGPYYATPSWDQKLPCDSLSTCPRFVVLANWNSEAVLDRETGLVWERQPGATTSNWFLADGFNCKSKVTGGRSGWRLPSFVELQTLYDGASNGLPAGHPFITVGIAYWSATLSSASDAYFVRFNVSGAYQSAPTNATTLYTWCVRGPSGL